MAETEENKELSHDEMYQSTKDVLSEAMDNLEQEPEYNEPKAPTFEEAQDAQTQDIEASKEKTTEDFTPTQQEPNGNLEEQPSLELSEEDNEFIGNLKPKAQERFKHWIDRANEAESKLQSNEPASQVFDHISDSTTNPDQLNWALNVFNSLNSGDYDNAKNALKPIREKIIEPVINVSIIAIIGTNIFIIFDDCGLETMVGNKLVIFFLPLIIPIYLYQFL